MSATAVSSPAAERPTFAPIGFGRLLAVETRKMFDTRSGFWLLVSIAILSVLATAGVLIFGGDNAMTFGNFAGAVGIPMSILLPVMAILSVTAEWSQRSGLTTFTLVPHRGRVILAKGVAAVLVGIVSMTLAMGIGAVGNLIGAAMAGIDPVWDFTVAGFFQVILGNVLSLLMGFMLGLLIRNSAGAIVGYFVYSFVIPTIFGILYGTQEWWRDIADWVDFQVNTTLLYGSDYDRWAELAVSGSIWLLLPLALGFIFTLRSEVK